MGSSAPHSLDRSRTTVPQAGLAVIAASIVAQTACVDPASAEILDASSAATAAFVMRPALAVGSLLMIVRIVLTWFPETKSKEFPWSIFYFTTEPVLSVTRNVLKPVGGVDIAPIVWFAFLSFMNEILLGPQGILVLLQNKL